MKRILILLFAVLAAALTQVDAQVAINTDASLPDASAMLDVKSTVKGVLFPRMSSALRTSIVSPADGLWVYDTDTKGYWYYITGTGWQQVPNSTSAFVLPYSASLNTGLTLFALTNTGSGMAISGSSSGTTAMYGATSAISGAGLLGDNLSGGEAVTGRTLSTGSPTGAVVGRNDGPGYGVSGFIATDNSGNGIGVLGRVGISGSSGVAGHFENLNASNARTTLEAVTNGTGSAATVVNTNNANVANILSVTSNGPGVIADHTQGNAGNFFMNNTSGVGAGVRGEVNSIFGNNGTAGVYGVASGSGGYAGYFEHSSGTGFGKTLYANTSGQGTVAHFETLPNNNDQATILAITNGVGSAASISNTNNTNVSNILNVFSNGPGVIADHSQGNAGNFFMNNTSGVGAGVRGEVNSIFGNNGTAGVYGISSGTGGYGGYFEHSNATGFGIALYANTNGQGVVAHLETLPSSNTQPTLRAITNGTGACATFSNTNNTNVANTIDVVTNGPGVIADHSQGNAGNFFVNNTFGVGAGVRGEVNSIFGNNGTAGVYGVSSGTGGYGGYFEHSNTSGFGITLQAISNGQGTVLAVNNNGSSGDLAIFQTSGFNKARIDRNGAGFFNGGTFNSGADLAELFEVEGAINTYEPGDVMQISATKDRTLEKSSSAYSTLVIGVYATKPGVVLTEEDITGNFDNKVPLGVVGVIPTKVCNENGPISRGDILVSAGKPGYAMKADLKKLQPGQSIGKALQSFDGITGKIKVMVNVK